MATHDAARHTNEAGEPAVIHHLSPEEHAASGKAARSVAPLESHAHWSPASDRPDPLTLLEAQGASRVAELLPIRYGRMMASPFAFYRGAATIMAADLAGSPASGIRAQLCGDAHLANFGGFESPERDLVFDVNDFDETLQGPWEWDVKRLVASFEIAGRDRGFTRKERRTVTTACARSYRGGMRDLAGLRDLDVWYSHLDVAGILARWRKEAKRKALKRLDETVAKAQHRDSLGALAKLTRVVDGQHRIISSPPLLQTMADLVPADELSGAVDAVRNALRVYRHSLPRSRRHLLERFEYADFARKVVGVGSVGTRSYVMLLFGRDDQDPLFLQIKEAQASALAPYVGATGYANQGQRVVEGQELLQAAPDIFLGWTRSAGIDGTERDYYVRQLWDGKLSADIEHMSANTLRIYAEICGRTLARAHARSGDRIAIAGYLGSSARFDAAVAEFAVAYADQNERDHQALVAAIGRGAIQATPGV